ncbi:MAG: hypothetical protein NC087_05305 [Anaeroplasma bactoclasticum]|nr:hypothetical protein [Anaeroplasma bactoclasticum]
MKHKTKHKRKFRFWYLCILLILCVSITLSSTGVNQLVCYAYTTTIEKNSPDYPYTSSSSSSSGSGITTLPAIVGSTPSASILPYRPGNSDLIVATPMPYITSGSTTSGNLYIQAEYPEGQLNAYDTLTVNNATRWNYYGGWQYASFVEYFTVNRTDGRPIYDDDGVLDVSWWNSDGNFGYSDEIIDYQSEIWVKTTLMPWGTNGFLGTVLNGKFKSGAYFDITWDRGEDPDDSIISYVHDDNANTMKSGNYRNNGVNPGDDYYKLCDWDYCSSPYITIVLVGTAYWENGWWGGSYDYTDIWSFMSGFMPRSNRNWSNHLTGDQNYVIQDGNILVSPSAFIVTASNLNNYVKINGKTQTPIDSGNCLPYKDGLKMAVINEGITTISIEDGYENNYTDYYCVVDSMIPDVTFNYSNYGAINNFTKSSITTDPTTKAKSQTVTGGVFQDQVQIIFETDSTESPERAYLTYKGNTYEIESGTWIGENGDYTLKIVDLAGNSTTCKFTVDTIEPNANLLKLADKTNYKISKWYLTSIPSGFNDYGTYSYKNYEDALIKAETSEKINLVTTYYLDDISNFHYQNLVASGDSVRTGEYWYYKSIDSPTLYVYYFNEDLLNKAIQHYAEDYVSEAHYFNYISDIYPNNYGNHINEDMYDNLWNQTGTPAYLANDFIFRTTGDNDSYAIFCRYVDDNNENWTQLLYNIPFSEQVSRHGLYEIAEMDYAEHIVYYYAFLDKQAPILEVTVKNYGEDESFTHTISANDIPNNNELIFYYEDFEINNVLEDDTWYVIKIRCPDGTTQNYTYIDTLPNLSDFGTGEYVITCYDRAGNNYSFKVCLLGKSPKVKFETINDNNQLKINILAGETYNELTGLKIYRNDNLLNNDNGYDEYPADSTNELIYISAATKQYTFNKGGLYKVEVTDNFGRVTVHEFKFEKDLPLGILKGVKDGGKTNGDVSFTFNSKKYIAVVYVNDTPVEFNEILQEDGRTSKIEINAKENINNSYKILLYDLTDEENFNTYKFTIKTILPELTLNGVKDFGTTSSDVYATWEIQSGWSATYTLNNQNELRYINGQTLTAEGVYEITLTDELGNKTTKTFEIDKSLDFTIYKDNQEVTIEEIRYTNQSIKFVDNETLHIEITKDQEVFDYEFGKYFNDEGNYIVKIYDDFGNSKHFEFTIDKTKPIASLIGVEENGTTSNFVQVVWEEQFVTAEIIKDGENLGNYSSGDEIKLNGKYEVIVSDRAGNFVSFKFAIDNKIMYDINTFKSGISNGGVRVIAKEDLTIQMFKNGEQIEYAFEQILNEDGYYQFVLTDEIGNQEYADFLILNTPIRRIETMLYESVTVTEIQKDGTVQELDIIDNILYLVDEGSYQVTVYDKSVNKAFSFNLTLDTTPPTIELVGVENGGATNKEVSTRNASEKPITITATCNGNELEYELGGKLEDAGDYKLVVTDVAGNQTEYEFRIYYSFNGATIALFGGMLAIVVLIIIFLVGTRKGFFKSKAEITTIEETTEEIDSIEEK